MNVKKATLQHFSVGNGSIAEDGAVHEKTLPFFSFVQAVEGEYELEIEGEGSFHCAEGDIFIASPFRRQRIVHRVSKNGVMKMRWVFAEPLINEVPMEQHLTLPVVIPEGLKEETSILLHDVFSAESYMCRIGRFFLFLDRLLTLGKPGFTAEKDLTADKVKRILHEEYSNPGLGVSDIADRLFLSRATVYRLFAEKIGMSPMAYLHRVRMQRAAYLLASTEIGIGGGGRSSRCSRSSIFFQTVQE